MKLHISFRNDQKKIPLPEGSRTVIRKCIDATLKETGFKNDAEISVTIVDNEKIRVYNKEYRDIDKQTDVLSFPLGENGEYDTDPENGAFMLGDIVISLEKAASQAEEYGHSLIREIAFLTTHSTLHLLGYDHETDKREETEMFKLQDIILEKLGIDRTK